MKAQALRGAAHYEISHSVRLDHDARGLVLDLFVSYHTLSELTMDLSSASGRHHSLFNPVCY
jgi:hypothetical protein